MSSRKSAHHAPGTILGSYRLGEVLGEGDMGIVYAATHTRLDRRVAIKLLRSEYSGNAQALHRFFAEARAVNKIAHPNIIEITDFVEQPGQDNYYVMELLEGASLAELVQVGGLLTLPRSIAIMTQVTEAVAAIHAAGIVHRDLKPANIILLQRGGRSDFVKIVDFGTARLVDVDDGARGAILGTPRYMSPEQAAGTPVDHRSDIYNVGAMLYELVTGRPPIAGANFREIADQLPTVIPPPPRSIAGLPHEVPPALDELIVACLAKRPEDRPASIDKVHQRLVAIAEEHGWLVYELSMMPSQPRIPAIVTTPVPVARSRRALWVVAIAGALAAAGAAYVVVARQRPASAPHADVKAKVAAELAIADQRIAAGRFVAPGGDEALDHLLAARALDPSDRGVRERLTAIARKYEQLANEAIASGSLAEAAAHLQTVLVVEPDNKAVAARMTEIEETILAHQRANPPRPTTPK